MVNAMLKTTRRTTNTFVRVLNDDLLLPSGGRPAGTGGGQAMPRGRILRRYSPTTQFLQPSFSVRVTTGRLRPAETIQE